MRLFSQCPPLRATSIGALAAVGLCLPWMAQAGGPATGTSQVMALRAPAELPTARLIIKYRAAEAGTLSAAGADTAALHRPAQAVAARSGLQLQTVRQGALGTHVMKLERELPVAEVRRLAEEIVASDPSIEYAEPDRILQPLMVPNDTQYGQQWHYFESAGGLRLPGAWDKSTGAGVVVGVLDTGYRPHADLAANIVGGHDFVTDTGAGNDGNGRDADARDPGDWCGSGETSGWHGTHVAGTVAAVTNNGTGVAGVAFGAKVLPVRVLGKCGGHTSDIADAIIWASGGTVRNVPANAHPAKVINLSLGGAGGCDITSQNAIDAARSRGTVVVVAAGNENTDARNASPASCNGVITVAATGRNGGRASYSNYGSVVEVAAPGGDMRTGAANGILSTLNSGTTTPAGDSFGMYQGTSMAAPHVAGVVALMLSKNPSLTPDQVSSLLQSTARPFPASCQGCGKGIVDAEAAVNAAGGGDTPPPSGGNEVEPNNAPATAQPVTSGTTVQGTFSSGSDTDYYKVTVPAGGTLSVTLAPNRTSDYDLYIYNGAGRVVARGEQGTGQLDRASVRNTSASPATYAIRAYFYSGGTGSTAGQYTLQVQ